MSILDHFGLIAPFYDQVFKPGELDLLLDQVGLPVEGALLDVGGGTGRISHLLVDLVTQVVIADLSRDMLMQANKKGGLHTTCAHSEQLPFQEGYFDRIIVIDALHHVCDQAETADELWRVLKPGGRIVIEEPNIQIFGVKILALAEKILGMRSHFLPPYRIAALFKSENVRIKSKGVISWVIIEKPVND
jgi:demethylmenaquinone methyltransferase/2-methoxy-6-polyprenyl-1,4-benzoquinol methylase